MKILSLFDWMSCWQIAINRLWIKDYIYYASEIDKYAIEVTQHNYPNTIQVWDITSIKWEDFKDIHLIMWWSPCQWFSFAGKQLNFEDERSKLFFEFVRLVKEIKPKYFLLENVKMKKKFQEIISENLFWINPIEINSDLVSAQNRKRLYWIWESQENWTYKQVKIEQPKDNGIFLKDILEDKVDEKYYMTEKQYKNLSFESLKRLYTKKAPTLSTMQWWHRQPKINLKDNNFTSFSQDNVFVWKDWKVPTLTAWDWWNRPKMYDFDNMLIRKLTPIECERLQTVPNNFTSIVSNSQRYKMLWNWWTVDIIVHILKNLKL
jgi:DNA-cytosine methyltransferase